MKIIINVFFIFILNIFFSCSSDDERHYMELDLKIKEAAKIDGVDLTEFQKIEKKNSKGYPLLVYSKTLPWKDTARIYGIHLGDFARHSEQIFVNGPYNYFVTKKREVFTLEKLFGDKSPQIILSPKQKEIDIKEQHTKSGEFLFNDLKKGNFFYLGKEKDSIIVQFYSPFVGLYGTKACILQEKENPDEITIQSVSERQNMKYNSKYNH